MKISLDTFHIWRQGSVVWLSRLMAGAAIMMSVAQPAAVSAYSISQGYNYSASEQIVPGLVVSLDGASNKIALTNADNITSAIGVAATSDSSLLTFSDGDSNVYVATNGVLPAFVSDTNGEVKAGDLLTISPIDGVLMKAGKDDTYILGIASESYNNDGQDSDTSITLDSGSTISVGIGLVSMSIERFTNPNRDTGSKLEEFGRRIVNKPVTLFQVVFGGAFLLLSMISVLVLMSGAIKNSIVAIGRNPLAKQTILKGLLQLSGLAVLILASGVIGAYVILWI